MRRALASLAALIIGAGIWAGTHVVAGASVDERARVVAIVYAAAWVALIVTATFALGTKRHRRVVEWAGANQFAQTLAIACATLRESAHALSAVQFSALVATAAFVAAMILESPDRRPWRSLAWLTLAAVPPLPGFFARIDGWSALWRADLTRLAVIAAVTQVAVLYALVRIVTSGPEDDAQSG